ncbi:hypothetical protein ACEV9E_23690, partial [Vibrio parahaemolyticus]
IFVAINFVIGLVLLLWVGNSIGIQAQNITVSSASDWATVFFVFLFTPVIGLMAYTFCLKLLSLVVKVLSWIETSTRSGAVGIMGFLLYAIQ